MAVLKAIGIFVLVFLAVLIISMIIDAVLRRLRLRWVGAISGMGLVLAWGTESTLESFYLIVGMLVLFIILRYSWKLRGLRTDPYVTGQSSHTWTFFTCYLLGMAYLLGYSHWMAGGAFANFIAKFSFMKYELLKGHLRVLAALMVVVAPFSMRDAYKLITGINKRIRKSGYVTGYELEKLATVTKSDKTIDADQTKQRFSLIGKHVGRLITDNKVSEMILEGEMFYVGSRFKLKLDNRLNTYIEQRQKMSSDELTAYIQTIYPVAPGQASEYLEQYCQTVASLEFLSGIYYVSTAQADQFFTCESCGITSDPEEGEAHFDSSYCSELCYETEQRCRSYQQEPGIEYAGLTAGIIQSGINYADNVVMGGERGHGFAAEKANHLSDRMKGRSARLVGGDNAKDGADRLVNGVQIQTKYCSTGSKCIGECFENGVLRYRNADGTPMQIEVPSDKYDAAVQAMEHRIRQGEVPGVNNPAKAKEIVRKGAITYQQARNIAKFGTIDSIKYDAARGISIAGTAMGISAAVTFANALWRGESGEKALKAACYSGLKTGGVTWVSSIVSAQLGRTGLESSMRGISDAIVKKMGSKTASLLANAGKQGANLKGAAAANHASKLLRGNIVTGLVTTAVLSSFDVARMVQGKMSGAQLFKNVATTAAGVAGGTAGWMAGAAAGAAIGSAVPIIGTAIGGFIGGLLGGALGGSAASSVAKGALDLLIEDDANRMYAILEKHLSRLAYDFMLNEQEVESVVAQLQAVDLTKELRNMYASSRKRAYANFILKPIVSGIVAQREIIELPGEEEIIQGTKDILEAAA